MPAHARALLLTPLLWLAWATHAHARDPEIPWRTDLTLATEAPLSLGPRLVVEGPYRIRVGASVGFIPGLYVDAINEAVVALGAYDRKVARLIELSLDTSIVARVDLGWRVWEERGFYFQLGYRYVGFGGRVEGEQVSALIEVDLPQTGQRYAYEVDSAWHMLDAELGWVWFLPYHILIHAGLGFAGTFEASAKVVSIYTLDSYEETATRKLNDIYDRYAFSPLVTLGLGYRFE